MTLQKKIARIAGIGYLVIFITGIYANFFVLSNLVVDGDAVTTARNIAQNGTTFRLGIFGFIIMVIADLVLTWALYVLFKTVNKNLSLFAAWFRLVNVSIFSMALFHLFNALTFSGGSEYVNEFDAGQLQALVMISVSNFNNTWLIGLVFFGIHLFALGCLILQSNFIPNLIGIFLIIASLGYLIDSFAHFLMPNYSDYATIFSLIVIIPGVIGELSFTFWLLLKGSKFPILE